MRRAAHNPPRSAGFTLVELMAAMAILVVIMLMLFSFLASAQRAWAFTETNTRIYENARILFEVVGRDLQSAVASAESGQEIPFYVSNSFDPDVWSDKHICTFVSAVGEPADATTRLCKVYYDYYRGAPGNPAARYQFRRAVVGNRTSSGWNADWDFYGETDLDEDWHTDGFTPQTVITGISDLKLDFLGVSAGVAENRLPRAVRVTVTLFDPKLYNSNANVEIPDVVREKTERSFTKMIFLRGRGRD